MPYVQPSWARPNPDASPLSTLPVQVTRAPAAPVVDVPWVPPPRPSKDSDPEAPVFYREPWDWPAVRRGDKW